MTEDKYNQFSDDAIRGFLLGRLEAAVQSTFETQLFTDDRLEARVRLAEFDLADDYALAHLSSDDRAAFEEKYLLSERRKRMLNVSTALRDRFASASDLATTVTKTSIGARLQQMFGLNQRAWRLAFGVAILAVLLGAAWVVWKKPRIAERLGVTIFNRRRPAPAPRVPQPAAHSTNTSSAPEHPVTPSPMLPHEPTASPTIVSVALYPGASNDENLPRVDLPKGEPDIVRFQLALKPSQTGSYRAELLTSDNQSIFVAQSLLSTDSDVGHIDFDVPAAFLKSGGYQVKLSRAEGGPTTIVASYYFRAQ